MALRARERPTSGCESGQPHDEGAPRCAASCSKARYAWDCHFCRCQACGFCAQLAVHEGGSAAGAGWHMVSANVTAPTSVVRQLSCPGGCEFQVHTLHIAGWSYASAASAVAATPALAPPDLGALRVQLRLTADAARLAGGTSMVGALLVRDAAAALHAPEERVQLAELRLGAQYAIMDLLEAVPGSSIAVSTGLEDSASVEHLRDVLVALVADSGSALYSGEVSRAVDAAGGISVVDEDGRARSLPMPSWEAARLTLLQDRLRRMSAHDWIYVLVAVGAALGAVWLLWSARSRPGEQGQYSGVLPTDEVDGRPSDAKRRRGGRQVESAMEDDDEEAVALWRDEDPLAAVGGGGAFDDTRLDAEAKEDELAEAAALARLDRRRTARAHGGRRPPVGRAPINPFDEEDEPSPFEARGAEGRGAGEQFDMLLSQMLVSTAGDDSQRQALEQMARVVRNVRERDTVAQPPSPPGDATARHADAEAARCAFEEYNRCLATISAQLHAGAAPSADAYDERDYWLCSLSDDDLQREYVRHSQAFLEPATPPPLREMSEALLVRLGGVLSQPVPSRREEAEAIRRAAAGRAAAVDPAMELEARWNREAHETLRALLTAVLDQPDADPALFRRLRNRPELRLVLVTPEEAAQIPHSEQLGWATRGLRPIELRAIRHALDDGAGAIAATRFREDLRAAVLALPPPRDDPQDPPGPNELFRL